MNEVVVGILGGGQLARMIALAGLPMGLRFVFFDPALNACTSSVGDHFLYKYDDRDGLSLLARNVDVVTYEFENVPEESLRLLDKMIPVFPPVNALTVSSDRLKEKYLFQELNIPTPAFAAVNFRSELDDAVSRIGLPAILKTRSLGYDGKGQAALRHLCDVGTAWERLGATPSILERLLDFEREVSILAVRSKEGKTAYYPLTENVHRGGILHVSRSRPGDPMEELAQEYARRVLDHLDYVGLMALEFFQVDDMLIANEMAPRVHNSGHWTIEGAVTSQFENHLRAMLGLPLGSTAPHGHAAMVNILGVLPASSDILAVPGTRLHLYGKDPRPGRKLGHVTIVASNKPVVDAGLECLLRAMGHRECLCPAL